MLVDLKNIVPISEANRNFSKVARFVDENGTVIIMKNNAPKYVIVSYDQMVAEEVADDEILEISKKAYKRHEEAYKKLGK